MMKEAGVKGEEEGEEVVVVTRHSYHMQTIPQSSFRRVSITTVAASMLVLVLTGDVFGSSSSYFLRPRKAFAIKYLGY